MSNKVFGIIRDAVVTQLEKGCVPWQKPWSSVNGGAPRNLQGRPYSGANWFLLSMIDDAVPVYGTFKAITAAGGSVKGLKGRQIVFYNILKKEDANGKETTIPMLRYFNVFNAVDAGLDIEVPDAAPLNDHQRMENCEAVIKAWEGAPLIKEGGNRACYNPGSDVIKVPKLGQFHGVHEYYSTLFHELIHSTGAAHRLNREELTDSKRFGDHLYSLEELVAEIGAAMLCAECGIDNTIDNSAAYVAGWASKLKSQEAEKWLIQAGSRAQKAVNMILGRDAAASKEEESEAA